MRRLVRSVLSAARRLLALLRERGFVVSIIGLLAVLYALGLVVPQRRVVPPPAWEAWRAESPWLVYALERSGLADVYRAPGTYVALGFFFLSLAAVLADRLPRLVRRTRLDEGLPLDAAVLAGRKRTLAIDAADPADGARRAAALLRAAGYRLHVAHDGAARAVRFRFAPLGFVLFHGAFGLLLAGAIALDLTRFSGVVDVGEGEPFDAASAEWAVRPRQPRFGGAPRDLAFTVADVRPRSERGHPLSLHVALLLRGEAVPRVANINEPVDEGTTSVLVRSAGAMPLFTCEAGGASDGAWVKLVPNPSGRTRFPLDRCGLDVLARPYEAEPARPPEGEGQGVMLGSAGVARLEDVVNNGIEVAVRGPDGAISRAVLRPGGAVATADGQRTLHMPELRYYARLQIVDERGGALLWAGFVLGVAGLVMRLVLFRREIAVVADPRGGRVLLAAAADLVGWAPDALLARVAEALRAREPAPAPAAAASGARARGD